MIIRSSQRCWPVNIRVYHGQSCSQSGVALLYVLLIFLLITTIASEIIVNLWLHTEKNTRYLERTQAKHYALGAEQYVAWLLENDFKQDQNNQRMVDHAKESWNIDSTGYEVEQGSIHLLVRDEQSLFNLNWLTENNKRSGRGQTQAQGGGAVQLFQNLLSVLSVDLQLADQLLSWMSQKNNNKPKKDQQALDWPQTASDQTDQEMTSVTELMLVNGFNREIIEKLLPYITAIPKSSKINMNTALPDVIRSLNPQLSDADVSMIINGRTDSGFSSREELNRLLAVSGLSGAFQGERVAFNSEYFSVYIKATYRDSIFYLKTLFYRGGDGRVTVLGREIGPAQHWVLGKEDGVMGIVRFK